MKSLSNTPHLQALEPSAGNIVPPELHQKLVAKVRAISLLELFASAKSESIPHVIVLFFVAWIAWTPANKSHVIIWLCAFLALHPVERWACSYTGRHGISEGQFVKWLYFARVLYTVNALFFCYAYWAFALESSHEDLFFTMIVGVMIIFAQVSRADLKILCAVTIPMFLTVLTVHLRRGAEHDYTLAMIITVAFIASLKLASQHGKHAFDALYNRFLMEDFARILKAKNDEVTRANQEVELATQTKSRFFAAASHDLRQPLHALSLLMGSLRLNMERKKNTEPTLEKMEIALGSLESLFNDVLNIAQLESGKINVEIESVSAQKLLQKLKLEFEPIAESKGLTLKIRPSRLLLQTDGVLLERILRNLISNAIKYTEKGGVLVACRESKQSGTAMIQVFDTGAAPLERRFFFNLRLFAVHN